MILKFMQSFLGIFVDGIWFAMDYVLVNDYTGLVDLKNGFSVRQAGQPK